MQEAKPTLEISWFDEEKGKRKGALDRLQMIALISVGALRA